MNCAALNPLNCGEHLHANHPIEHRNNMKKLITFSLALAVTLAISACQSKKASNHEGHTPHIHADGSTHYH